MEAGMMPASQATWQHMMYHQLQAATIARYHTRVFAHQLEMWLEDEKEEVVYT